MVNSVVLPVPGGPMMSSVVVLEDFPGIIYDVAAMDSLYKFVIIHNYLI